MLRLTLKNNWRTLTILGMVSRTILKLISTKVSNNWSALDNDDGK
jgi:hypothetical protein